MSASAPATATLGVVLYRNPSTEVERLLRSLHAMRAEAGNPAFDVAWVDNSPTPELQGAIVASSFGRRYRHAGSNLGFGAAHNQLMAEAFANPRMESYVCVNPDAVLHPTCLLELRAEAARHARAGLVEARQFPDEHPKPYDPATHETPWCSACVLLVTRELYSAIGGFDERFFMYCEDVDLSWRARAAGFTLALAPRALAHHVATHRAGEQRMRSSMLASGYLLGEKYENPTFAAACADELRRFGGRAPTSRGTPASAAERAVADFAHGLTFSEGRW